MKTRFLIFAIIFCLILVSCGPGQALGPTITPSPTTTPIPTNTPIPTPTITPTPIGKSSGMILFDSDKQNDDLSSEIYVVDLSDFKTTKLLSSNDEKVFFSAPMASHDGKKIVYVRNEDAGALYYGDQWYKSEIYIMEIDGNNPEKISSIQSYVGQTQISDYLAEHFPAWSPDDKKLVFTSNRTTLVDKLNPDEAEIFVIDLENYSIQQLTSAKGISWHPYWSPDGEFITFMSNRDGDWDIYYMKSDGSGNDIKITNNTSADRYPSWSHDGEKIIYHSDRDGNFNLYIYYFNTQEEMQLTNYPSDEFTARWSPDDKWITYASDRDGDDEIYIMNLETKEEIKVTDNEVNERFQNWIP